MRPPILYVTMAFAAGLGAGLSGRGEWGVVACVLLGATALAQRAPVGAACGIMAVAGLLWGGAAARERSATCGGVWGRGTGEGGGGTRAATVRLRDPVAASGGVVEGDVTRGLCGGTLKIRWPERHRARGGTTWVVAGRWLGDAGRGILVARRVRLLDSEPRGRGGLRDRVAERSARLFGSRAPLVDALVIARRAELEADVRERYARSGLAHILSISGLHVGFIAAWLGLLLRLLRLGARTRFAAATTFIAAYCWFLGLPAPATRAALMLTLDGIARLRQRVVAPRGIVALAALTVLVIDPWALRSVGAWLSVAAVAAVIWAGRATERSGRLVRLLAPATAATLLTAPIAAYAFGTVAPIGVLANLVAIPLGAVAVPGLIVALLLSSSLLAAGSGLCLALLDLVAGWAAAVPGGHVVMTADGPAALLWLGVLAAAWWLWRAPRRPWLIAARVAFIGALLSCTALLSALSRLSECHCLTVHFLDVGQGDAAALRTPAGRWVLIDGGPRTPQSDAGRRVVVPFLRRHGATRLAAVVATHGDADHLGGLPVVVETLDPELVLEPGEPLGRPLYLEFLAAVEGAGSDWRAARRGDRLELDGVRLEVLSPDSAWVAQPLDVNEHGVVLRVAYGETRLLFEADAGFATEARLAGRAGRVTVLKVGHHGSRTATSEAWLDELRPEDAVISVGARNTYGHPAPEVLARLAARGVRVYRTDRSGTITLESDGRRVRIDGSHHD
jgi:competence protein ComEC